MCACAACAVSASLLAASAQAAVYQVVGTGATLHVRSAPSLGAPIVAGLTDGTSIDIVCQMRGDQVVGSTMWDKIDQPVTGYVADWYTTTPVVNNPSPGLPPCGPSGSTPAPNPTPATPTTHCGTPGERYETGTYVETLSASVCTNGTTVTANWYHATLDKKIPLLFATITGSGVFHDQHAYAGPGAPPAPALTIWSNEDIKTPGTPETLFQPALEEWRYVRINVFPNGTVHQCTWFTDRFADALTGGHTVFGTHNCA